MPYRSAVTGEFVDEEYAKAHPDTTVWEEPEEDTTDVTTDQPQQDNPELAS